jgi:hypothetical protein
LTAVSSTSNTSAAFAGDLAAASPVAAVGQAGRDGDGALAAHLHAGDALVEARDDLRAPCQRELERPLSILVPLVSAARTS